MREGKFEKMHIKYFLSHKAIPKEQAKEKRPKSKCVVWPYRSIPMTLELSRRKEEEELLELFHIQKFKRACIINRGERRV